jgi:UDP-glucose:(heptosyl)LPS alpha-1,3-glucosyltransferase
MPWKIGLIKRAMRLAGGSERQLGYLIDGLRAQGYELHLFSQQPPMGALAHGLTWHRVPALPGPPTLRLLSFALATRAAIRRAELTLAHSFERTLGQQIYRAGEGVHREWLARKRRALPALARGWTVLSPYDRLLVRLERRVFRETPLIIANSQRGRQEIARHYGVDPARITTIYNGVDTARFHPGVGQRWREAQRAAWGVAAETVVGLFVGAGFQRKGLTSAIDALALLRARGCSNLRLVVVGKGRAGPYARLAAQRGVADLVRFEGERDDVERCYAGADLLVLPTLYDPFANVCLEAMACGLPVLTTEANGAAELLQDGVNGVVVADALDREPLVDALQHLLSQERRRVLGEAAAKTAREYPLSRALGQTLQAYASVVHHGV